MKYYFLALALVVLAGGCGRSSGPAVQSAAAPATRAQEMASDLLFTKNNTRMRTPQTAAPKPAAEAMPRKIIYMGSVDLIVVDLSGAVSKLDDLVKHFHGLIAESQMSTNPWLAPLGQLAGPRPGGPVRGFRQPGRQTGRGDEQ